MIHELLHKLNNMDDEYYLEESFEIHNQLNPQLFEFDGMIPEIRTRLVEIADMFVSKIQEDNIPIKVLDYWLVGSNAQYNYGPKSDIDIHIIVNMEQDYADPYIIKLLYDYIKSDFNNKYDIEVKGHEVELYIEDVQSSAVTNGIYSLKQDKWIKVPIKEEPKTFDITTTLIWNDTYSAYENLKDEDCEEFLDKLYVMRKISLANDGEWGEGNLVFKEFRNRGYIEDLRNRKYKYKSKELTLENLCEGGPSGQSTAKNLLFNAVGTLQEPTKYGIHHLNNIHTDHVSDNVLLIPVGKHRTLHAALKNKRETEAVEAFQTAFYIQELKVAPIDAVKAKLMYDKYKDSY